MLLLLRANQQRSLDVMETLLAYGENMPLLSKILFMVHLLSIELPQSS
jgi:hypothetical protein